MAPPKWYLLKQRGLPAMAYLQRNVVFIAYARRNAVEVEAVSETLELIHLEFLRG